MKRTLFDRQSPVLLIPFIILFSTSLSYGQWTVTTSPDVSTSLYSVYLIDSNEGWAAGGSFDLFGTGERRGRLFHYLDGAWTDVQLDYTSSCWGLGHVQFISREEGCYWGRLSKQPIPITLISLYQWRLGDRQFTRPVSNVSNLERLFLIFKPRMGHWNRSINRQTGIPAIHGRYLEPDQRA